MFNVVVQRPGSGSLRRLIDRQLAAGRREMVRRAMRDTLVDVIRFNPVDTARSRSAWATPLERLGGVPPAGWQGPRPSAVEEGSRLGRLEERHDRDVTEIAVSNGVRYVPLLEFGTSRMKPFAMVRRSLVATRRRIRRFLR